MTDTGESGVVRTNEEEMNTTICTVNGLLADKDSYMSKREVSSVRRASNRGY